MIGNGKRCPRLIDQMNGDTRRGRLEVDSFCSRLEINTCGSEDARKCLSELLLYHIVVQVENYFLQGWNYPAVCKLYPGIV